MAATIEKNFKVDSELVRLSNGIFNVYVDGEKIWDKHEQERFPEESEIVSSIAAMRTKG